MKAVTRSFSTRVGDWFFMFQDFAHMLNYPAIGFQIRLMPCNRGFLASKGEQMSRTTKRYMSDLQILNVPCLLTFLLWIQPLKERKKSLRIDFIIERLKIQSCCMRFAFHGMHCANFDLNCTVTLRKYVAGPLRVGAHFRFIVT